MTDEMMRLRNLLEKSADVHNPEQPDETGRRCHRPTQRQPVMMRDDRPRRHVPRFFGTGEILVYQLREEQITRTCRQTTVSDDIFQNSCGSPIPDHREPP